MMRPFKCQKISPQRAGVGVKRAHGRTPASAKLGAAKEEDVRVRVPTELHEALLRSALHSMSNGAVAQEQIQRGETLELLSQISKRMTSAMLRCTFTTSMVLTDVAPADASMVMSAGIL